MHMVLRNAYRLHDIAFIYLLTVGGSTTVSTPSPSTLHEDVITDTSTQPDNGKGKGQDIDM